MKATRIPSDMEARAAEALNVLLHQVSSIKTREIRFQPVRRKSNILANIDVLGRHHRLVCNVAEGQPEDVKEALEKLRSCADGKKAGATQVLIMRHMTPLSRALCEKNRVGFIDLEGNARIEVDEVFIGKRSVRNVAHPPAMHSKTA